MFNATAENTTVLLPIANNLILSNECINHLIKHSPCKIIVLYDYHNETDYIQNEKVKYVKNNPKLGVVISIENLEKMPLPVIIDIKFKSGEVKRVNLPVEIWQKNVDWSFKYDSIEEIDTITLDPDHVFPDVNSANNTWTAAAGELENPMPTIPAFATARK
jgi:hypothetical protein